MATTESTQQTAQNTERPVRRPINWSKLLLWTFASLVFMFLLLPSLVVVPMALTPKDILEFPPSGLSLHTFGDLFRSEPWMASIVTSLEVAGIAVLLSGIVGTFAAIGLHGATFRGRGIVTGLILMPLTIPLVVLALGYFGFLVRINLAGTTTGIALAHAVLATPYVYLVVAASLTGLDPALIRAVTSSGGGGLATFWHVYVPVIRAGVAAGILFAFTVSFDEVVIAYFLQSPDATTLPVKMFTDIQYDLTPTIAAVSTLMLLLTALIFVVQILASRRRLNASLVPGMAVPTPK
jgi:putative spermidine/putrescine transport system permease protein